MRKIEKNLAVIPDSLTKGNTKSKRLGVIANGYPTSNKQSSKKEKEKVKVYDKIFKTKDILDLLDSIYHSKCVYCEEKIYRVNADNLTDNSEKKHSIDHYRPKSKYPWLAFSWDNLLWCCDICNQNKDNDFKIINKPIIYSRSFMSRIHCSTKLYNRVEKPKMIHPELEDITDKLVFDTNGNINSEDDRVKYTITTCGLDRNYLNGERKEILDEIINKFQDPLVQKDDEKKKEIIKKFKEDSENMNNEFIAFRIWVLTMFQKGKR